MKRRCIFAGLALVAIMATAATATAGDAVKIAVSNPSPAAIITENGNPYSVGTYGVGTVQLLYTVNANAFTPGTFATFTLSMGIKANDQPGQATAYPTNVTLDQTGSTNLTLTPATDFFNIPNQGWSDSTVVTISIPAGVPNDDGTTLVGNLQFRAPHGDQLKTTTTVQVKIMLVYPAGSCLKLYNFVTDESFTTMVSSIDVNVIAKKGTIASTNPYGQLSNNALVVNTCSAAMAFDLQITLDSWWNTNPQGNPGNAVFTYFKTGTVDPSTFSLAAFGTGTPQGQSLQLTNISLAAGESFLATVHMGIGRGLDAAGLGALGTFSFSSTVFPTGGGTALAGPATTGVTYAVK